MGVCETKAQACSCALVIMCWSGSPSPIIAAKHVLLYVSGFIHWPNTAKSRDSVFESHLAHARHKHTVCEHRDKMTVPQSDRHLHTEPHLCECTPWTQRDAFSRVLQACVCIHPSPPPAVPDIASFLRLNWALGVSNCSSCCPPLPAACCLSLSHIYTY